MPEIIPVNLLAWLVLLSVLSISGAIIGLPLLLLSLPADYFSSDKRHAISTGSGWQKGLLVTLKNLLGLFLLVTGIFMLVLPGQGLLTMFGGLILMDFPGKFRLERRLVLIPRVTRTVNWIRRRGGKPPFELN